MKEFSVDVLGSEWRIQISNNSEEKRLSECLGFTDWTSKKIVITEVPPDTNLDISGNMMDKVLRHELVHAFLFESGLGDDFTHPDIGHDETMVDWVAYQMPKIMKAYIDAKEKLRKVLEEIYEEG